MGSRHASLDPAVASNAFSCSFANNGHRNSIQLSNLCAMCRKKPFLKSLSISDEILSKFGIRGTPEYQRMSSKGLRTMGSEWPDKHDKTGFGSVAKGGGGGGWGWGGRYFSRDHPPQLNSVGYLGWFEWWDCFPYGHCFCRQLVGVLQSKLHITNALLRLNNP